MKQIKVNESCSGCGLCIANCAYLEENEEGNAQPVVGKVIKKDDEQLVKKVIKGLSGTCLNNYRNRNE